MKKHAISRIFLCLSAVLIYAGPFQAHADNPWDVEEDIKATNEETEFDVRNADSEMDSSVYGKVIGVNIPGNSLTVLADGRAMTLFIQTHTTFTTVSSVAQISPGDMVTVDYYTSRGKAFAENILPEESGQTEETPVVPHVEKVLED